MELIDLIEVWLLEEDHWRYERSVSPSNVLTIFTPGRNEGFLSSDSGYDMLDIWLPPHYGEPVYTLHAYDPRFFDDLRRILQRWR